MLSFIQKQQQTHEIPEASGLIFFTKFRGEGAGSRRFEWYQSLTGVRDNASRRWAKFYVIYNSDNESLKHILKGCLLLRTSMCPPISLYLDFPKRSTCVFDIILSVLKHEKDLRMRVHSEHLKRHRQEKRTGPLPVIIITATRHLSCFVLKNRHHGQKEERLTMYSRCHCLDSRAQHHLSLKKEAEKKNQHVSITVFNI